MSSKPVTFSAVFAQISRNGLYGNKAPSVDQCKYLAALIVEGVEKGIFRWDMGESGWTGRTKWQMSKMIDSFKNQIAQAERR